MPVSRILCGSNVLRVRLGKLSEREMVKLATSRFLGIEHLFREVSKKLAEVTLIRDLSSELSPKRFNNEEAKSELLKNSNSFSEMCPRKF